MAKSSPLIAKVGAAATLTALMRRRRRRSPKITDPVHAPGHRHRAAPPDVTAPPTEAVPPKRNQPWVRRSHSDSQKRRFRR